MTDTGAVLARKRELTEQLRLLDETLDTACGLRGEDHQDDPPPLPARDVNGVLMIEVDGTWWPWASADELTRLAMYFVDAELEQAGLVGA